MHSFVINAALVLSAGSSTVRTYPCRLSAPGPVSAVQVVARRSSSLRWIRISPRLPVTAGPGRVRLAVRLVPVIPAAGDPGWNLC
jgi:hypothetical protein